MRLTCPNCEAQYEVPDEVIPDAGRDVQCSNCGDTWFQAHPDHPVDGDADHGSAPDADGWSDSTPRADDAAPAAEDFALPSLHSAEQPHEAEAEAEADAVDDDPAREHEHSEHSDEALPRTERLERREMDPSIASVLREEAEREKRARAAAQGGLETQPELGLADESDEMHRIREARMQMARMRGEDSQTDEEDSADDNIDPTTRRSLFPDIEEINSSLSPDRGPQSGEPAYDLYPDAASRPSGGFRRGFLLAILIAIVALLLYIFAPLLSDMLPALRGVLDDYVAWVDGLRQWLDTQMAAAMLWLDNVTGAGGNTGAPTNDGTGG